MSTNKIVANALKARNVDPDTVGVYSAAKKMIAAGAKHITGYMWEIPEGMVHGANVIVGRTGGKVKVVRPSDRKGFVVAEVTDPLAQALERKGVLNALKAINRRLKSAEDKFGNEIHIGDMVKTKNGKTGRVVEIFEDHGEGPYVIIEGDMRPYKSYLSITKVSNSVATNADRVEEKSFGNGDVKASMKDFGRDPIYEIAVYTTGITSAVSFADKGKKCVAEARAVLSAVERKASALKQAIAWMEQNAKKW